MPLAVGKGIPPLEHKGAQVEAPQECSAYQPWAFGHGAWQSGVPVGGAHACKACVSFLIHSYGNPIRTATTRASKRSHRALSECTIMNLGLHQTLYHAVDQGIEAYITSRRARISLFIHQHFSFRGALALHRKTFGRDVYKYPVNLMWGLPVALVTGAADLLDKAGATRTAQWLHRMPRGMPTALHQELQWLLYTELLELPYAQEGRASHRDALLEHILADPRIAALCDEYLTHLHGVAEQPAFRAALERHLAEYGKTRGAVSELAGSLLHLAAGYAALSKATPGALSVGTAAATAIAQHLAIANFWLGSTVGAWYYAVFPVTASAGLVAATTGALLAAGGVVTALAWLVLDPLLATTGIHRRRLDRFVTALGEELRGGRGGAYRVRDHYIARVFDVLELLRTASTAFR